VRSTADRACTYADFDLPVDAVGLFAGALEDVGTLGIEERAGSPSDRLRRQGIGA
jgi:hypothetical protein